MKINNIIQHPKGFTLMELLIVVLIVGILSAMALPLYNRAVMKSRYTALLPITKAIAEANDAYYMEHGEYAEQISDLTVKAQDQQEARLTLGSELGSGEGYSYAYTLAQRDDLPGLHYIIYQQKSENFPGERHCEAIKTDKKANWLCAKGMKGKKLGGALTEGYNSYLLEGEGQGITQTVSQVLAGTACSDEEKTGGKRCDIIPHADGSKTKMACTGAEDSTCTWTTVNTDGTKTVCNTDNTHLNARYQNGVCMGGFSYPDPFEITYDEDGNIVAKKMCSTGASSLPTCARLHSYTYNEDGSYEAHSIDCGIGKNLSADGLCPDGVTARITDTVYNANEHVGSYRTCRVVDSAQCETHDSGEDYTYDAQGSETSHRVCAEGSIPLEGKCTAYIMGTDYTNDAQGNHISERYCSGAVPAEGKCTAYSSGTDYTYNAQGNHISERYCSGAVPAEGKCTYDFVRYFTYDESGNQTGGGDVFCGGSVNSSGYCNDGWTIYDYETGEETACSAGQVINWGDGSSAPTCANPS